MDLTATDVRVLGCLIEKELTTPDQYPLTTNSLRLACNQKTNREPVVDFSDSVVDQAMLRLRQAGLARTVSAQSMRTSKHRHVLGEALGLDREELALLSTLMVRGPQTAGELRGRSERMATFDSVAEVEAMLGVLAGRTGEALVARLDRQPGHKEERWVQLLSGEEFEASLLDTRVPGSKAVSGGPAVEALTQRVETLERELAVLGGRFEALCRQLGVDDPAVA